MKMLTQVLFVFLIVSVGQAAPVYVDAEGGAGGNTVRASDGHVDAWWTSATAPDGLWGRRTGFANNPNFELGTPDNDIFEASGTGSEQEDAVLIVTTITDLNPGSMYRVDVVFWSSTSQNWSIRAGFDSETSRFYDRLGADGATAGTPTEKTEGDRAEYTGFVGYAEADQNGQIKVYINDKPSDSSQGGWYDRTWYDGLLVEKFSVASDPTPPDDPAGENPVPVTEDLSWTVLDSNVEYIDLYLGTENEPNLALKPQYKKLDFEEVSTLSLPYDPGTLEYETVYYWRIDTYEPNTLPGGTGSLRAVGPVWSFVTVPEAPVVSPVVPAYTAVEGDGTVDVQMSAAGINIESYAWYKLGDPDPLPDDEKYDGVSTNTLTIHDVVPADEGYYYCIGSNAAGSDSSINEETGQGAGRLLTYRLMSYYPMEVVSVVGDETITPDVVGDYDLVLTGDDAVVGIPTLDTNVPDPAVGSYSLRFDNDGTNDPNGQYAVLAAGVADYEDLTLAAWITWNGGANWQRILDFGNNTSEYLFLSPISGGGNLRFAITTGGGGSEQRVETAPMPVEQWVYVAVTLRGDTARLYVNGELIQTNTGVTLDPMDIRPTLNYLGKSQFDDPYFNGLIDDLKIYNYARTTEQIALDYLAVRGDWICNNELTLPYDFDGDCRIGLSDFAIFADTWLQSNRIYAP